ncbi:MAG TPA: hypothetical protein DDX33_06905 [Rikenellaceae bacterium]|nr:hypothetical protein [Rikenellaceae bacterium]
MRNITTFVAALAALAIVSCNKNSVEQPPVETNERIELDLTIAGFDDSADTKAVKKGWTKGDKINLWFDDWNFDEQKVAAPDLIITYDGSKWTSGKFAEGRSPKAEGKFTAVYEGSNDIMSQSTRNYYYNYSMWYFAANISSDTAKYFKDVNPRDVCYMPMYIFAQGIDYNFADNKLSATVSAWKSYSSYKITVKGIPEGDYAMQINNNPENSINGIVDFATSSCAFVIAPGEEYPKASAGSANNSGYTGGLMESDGMAFYYRSASWEQTEKLENATIRFRLIDLSNGKAYRYQVTDKTIDLTKRTNIALNYLSFTAE